MTFMLLEPLRGVGVRSGGWSRGRVTVVLVEWYHKHGKCIEQMGAAVV